MSYAIMRLAKLKSWSAIAKSGAHTYRTISTPNADPERFEKNITGKGTRGNVYTDVKTRLKAVTDKPRKNAVLCLEFLLTASPEFFKDKSDKQIKAWASSNSAWLKEKFRSENLTHIVLHQDETTPHLVAYVVPELAGRLNAKGLIGSPEMMSDLQTSYAEHMAQFGLERGLKGSKASHQTIRQWYGQVNATASVAAERLASMPEPTDPPALPLLQLPAARKEAVQGWKRKEKEERQRLIKDAAKSAMEAESANLQIKDLMSENNKLTDNVIELRRKLSAAYDALGLTKEEISSLRKSNTSLIAQRLGHDGPILPKENAIDLLKRVAGFDYSQSIAWLHAEFGPVITGGIVSKASSDADEPRPLTKAENVILKAVDAQLDALDCEQYRVTLMSYDENQKPFLPGKQKGKEVSEKFYSASEIKELIPFLRYQNNQGMNVLITPMDTHAYYILLDDARVSYEELKNKGFEPCLFQSTSWNSQQAVFKIPKNHDRDYVMAVFKQLNEKMGDPKMEGLRHPFRLAGFRNMKPKHLKEGTYPFVKVLAAVNTMCRKCLDLVKACDISTYSQAQQHKRI